MHLAFAMYEKMQEAGLIEIIPLICTFTGQGQYPDFPHPKSPQCARAAGAAGMMAVTSFVPWDDRQHPLPTIHSQHVHRIEHEFFLPLSFSSFLAFCLPFQKYSLNIYYKPEIVLGAGKRSLNKIIHGEACVLMGESDST